MSKYDWESLKSKFIIKNKGNEKYTLKDFAEEEKIQYSLLRKHSAGWIEKRGTKQEQKRNTIQAKTLERQIENEVEMNLRHYDIANKLLDVMGKTFDIDVLVKSPKAINTLAKALKTVQEVQRTASGADKQDISGGGIVQDFIKAVESADEDVSGHC